MAISGVQAAVRLSRGPSVSSSLNNTSGRTSGLRTSAEYTTASEDEGESDVTPSTADQSPRPFAQHRKTTDAEAEKAAQAAQAQLDQGMQKVLAKANEMQVRN